MRSRCLIRPSGLNSFRSFLESKLNELRQSPVLVIASEPAERHQHLSIVTDSCQTVAFTLAQQFGLRTVPSTISSAFPTMQDLEQRTELIRRTGACNVVAVGSGAAMDLGKALGHNNLENIILVPSTSAAILAASTSHSLFLDSAEETLVPVPTDTTTITTTSTSTTILPLESRMIAPAETSHVLFACLSLVLDACNRRSKHPLLLETKEKVTKLLLEASPEDEFTQDQATDLLYAAGQLVSYGLNDEDRSTPIALASSLIPPLFPHVHILQFLASLLPGICARLSEDDSIETKQILDIVQTIAPDTIPKLIVNDESLKGFSIPDMSLSHIRSNQTVWKSLDVADSVLLGILEHGIAK